MFKHLLCLLFLTVFSASSFAQQSFPTPELQSLNLQPVQLSERIGQGKPTVVAIWATWCQPCHMELDHMQKFLDKWQNEYGVEVLAVSVDKRHMVNRIAPLVSRKGWGYKVLVDSNSALQSKLGFRSIPQMYVLDGSGKIVKEFSGYENGREGEVDRLLAKLVSK